mmetsp:Transcript_8773/g.25060  ORF Transcript_8773/g.25060 Transcript_8773/m.25060 type:complete len:192 (+) Transcript_8773:895-1470(+)
MCTGSCCRFKLVMHPVSAKYRVLSRRVGSSTSGKLVSWLNLRDRDAGRIRWQASPLAVNLILLASAGMSTQLSRNLGSRTLEKPNQVAKHVSVMLSEQGRGQARLARSSSAANTVGIAVNFSRHLVVDDVCHVTDVQATTGHICGNENVESSTLESRQVCLAYTLLLAAVKYGRPLFCIQKKAEHMVTARL